MSEIKQYMELENFCYMEEIPRLRKRGIYNGIDSNNLEIQSQRKGSSVHDRTYAD